MRKNFILFPIALSEGIIERGLEISPAGALDASEDVVPTSFTQRDKVARNWKHRGAAQSPMSFAERDKVAQRENKKNFPVSLVEEEIAAENISEIEEDPNSEIEEENIEPPKGGVSQNRRSFLRRSSSFLGYFFGTLGDFVVDFSSAAARLAHALILSLASQIRFFHFSSSSRRPVLRRERKTSSLSSPQQAVDVGEDSSSLNTTLLMAFPLFLLLILSLVLSYMSRRYMAHLNGLQDQQTALLDAQLKSQKVLQETVEERFSRLERTREILEDIDSVRKVREAEKKRKAEIKRSRKLRRASLCEDSSDEEQRTAA